MPRGPQVPRKRSAEATSLWLTGSQRPAQPALPVHPPATLTSSPEPTEMTLAVVYSGVTAPRGLATCRRTVPCSTAPTRRFTWPTRISASPTRISRLGPRAASARQGEGRTVAVQGGATGPASACGTTGAGESRTTYRRCRLRAPHRDRSAPSAHGLYSDLAVPRRRPEARLPRRRRQLHLDPARP